SSLLVPHHPLPTLSPYTTLFRSKIINDPQSFVDETIDGILLAHPDQLRAADADRRAIVRADAGTSGRVGIVTGGGSGHLPLFLRSEEHTSELQSRFELVCRLLLE